MIRKVFIAVLAASPIVITSCASSLAIEHKALIGKDYAPARKACQIEAPEISEKANNEIHVFLHEPLPTAAEGK